LTQPLGYVLALESRLVEEDGAWQRWHEEMELTLEN